MNRREAIKAGLVCVIAPIAAKKLVIKKRATMGITEARAIKDLWRVKLNRDQQRIFNAMIASDTNKAIKVGYDRKSGTIDIKPISFDDFYKRV